MAKMSKKWVVLCSAALGAIYAAEYFTTDAQASLPSQVPGLSQPIFPFASPSVVGALPSNPTGGGLDSNVGLGDSVSNTTPANQDLKTSPTPMPTPTPTPKPTPKPTVTPAPIPVNKLYNDGTYTGVGSNRRGYIQVTVKTNNDKIADVEISDFGMHYSERDVVGLPDEVLQKQSAEVDNVSGATYSVRAFEDAVQQALSQAKVS